MLIIYWWYVNFFINNWYDQCIDFKWKKVCAYTTEASVVTPMPQRDVLFLLESVTVCHSKINTNFENLTPVLKWAYKIR